MKNKAVWITIISLVIFSAVVATALNAVFTVTKVETNFSTCSVAGEAESKELQRALEEAYRGKSTTFLDLAEVEATVAQYPCFALVSVQKKYPQKILLEVTERKECYAFKRENGRYAVIDENGLYLYDKDGNENRRGGENVLLKGFGLLATDAGKPVTGEYFSCAMTLFSVFREGYGDVRANISSVTLAERDYWGAYLQVRMKEGVSFIITEPNHFTQEKMQSMMQTYASLSETQKLYGYVDITDLSSGESFSVSQHGATSNIIGN